MAMAVSARANVRIIQRTVEHGFVGMHSAPAHCTGPCALLRIVNNGEAFERNHYERRVDVHMYEEMCIARRFQLDSKQTDAHRQRPQAPVGNQQKACVDKQSPDTLRVPGLSFVASVLWQLHLSDVVDVWDVALGVMRYISTVPAESWAAFFFQIWAAPQPWR